MELGKSFVDSNSKSLFRQKKDKTLAPVSSSVSSTPKAVFNHSVSADVPTERTTLSSRIFGTFDGTIKDEDVYSEKPVLRSMETAPIPGRLSVLPQKRAPLNAQGRGPRPAKPTTPMSAGPKVPVSISTGSGIKHTAKSSNPNGSKPIKVSSGTSAKLFGTSGVLFNGDDSYFSDLPPPPATSSTGEERHAPPSSVRRAPPSQQHTPITPHIRKSLITNSNPDSVGRPQSQAGISRQNTVSASNPSRMGDAGASDIAGASSSRRRQSIIQVTY